MSEIKAANTAFDSAISAEKEVQLAKQQAELITGEAQLQEFSNALTKQQENIQAAHKDTQSEPPKDSAELSDIRRRLSADGAISPEEALKWILEMEGEKWEAFLQWQPNPNLALPKQLQELSKLYLSLLEAALKYAEGENLTRQLERLDALLAQKLTLIMDENLKSLASLLKESGQSTALDSVRASLYRQTAGRTISPQAAHALFTRRQQAGGRSMPAFGSSVNESARFQNAYDTRENSWKEQSRQKNAIINNFQKDSAMEGMTYHPTKKQNARHQQAYHLRQNSGEEQARQSGEGIGSSRNSRRSAPQEGMIYQPAGKQGVRFGQACHTQQNSWKEQIRQRNEVISNSWKGIAENTFKQGSSNFCCGRELEKANRFASHLDGSGNLFKNPGITARNEEVTGLLAAVMSIKGQVYAKESKQGTSIALALERAIEKITLQYLNRKGASNVYYHTLSAYKQTQNAQKAIEKGQEYAYRQFQKKQGDPAYQKSPHYSKESGFFRAMTKNISPEKGFALGSSILQKDWQNFLTIIRNRQDPYSSRADIYSPWGMLADTKTHLPDSGGTVGKILLGAAVLAILCALAIACFRLI